MPRMSDFKRMNPKELRTVAEHYETDSTAGRHQSLLLAAELRDIAKGKLSDQASRHRENGDAARAEDMFNRARVEAIRAFENRRVARRVKLRMTEQRARALARELKGV